MKRYLIFIMAFTMGITSLAKEYHVAKTGNDANPGTIEAPLHTIQAAANLAQPGDVITLHAGVYRERITPPKGGESDTKRII
jgi:alpha-N-arabinofuranosidase